jgi:arsenite-transporting ATPase
LRAEPGAATDAEAAGAPRVVLVTGKGGVGKTTSAAALAVGASRRGMRTLLMSTDVAHSLGDALAIDLRAATAWDETTPIEANLSAQAVDARTAVHASWEVVRDYLLGLLGSAGVDAVIADELIALPGADEIAALLTLGLHAESGVWDLIVIDCAPTAETLRLLSLPELIGWHLDRLLPTQRRVLSAIGPAAAAASGLALPSREVLAVVHEWRRQMLAVRRLVVSPRASVRLVVTPERVVIAEARRTLAALTLHGYAVDHVLVNRLIPVDDDPWRSAWNQAQEDGMAEIVESFRGIPISAAPYLAGEPTGVDALADLEGVTALVAGEEALLDAPVTAPALSVTPEGRDFVLSIEVPFARSADVGVLRRGDDIVVTLGPERRIIALPAVLRRCIVKNASVGKGRLKIRFERDPGLWPHEQ